MIAKLNWILTWCNYTGYGCGCVQMVKRRIGCGFGLRCFPSRFLTSPVAIRVVINQCSIEVTHYRRKTDQFLQLA
ncbi:Uncharacterised protein [Mycobacteroides abscessus subsp. abscessus]|nr:Uncharacterised protein [Mycobacteroides abscessus subsp. abscessus]